MMVMMVADTYNFHSMLWNNNDRIYGVVTQLYSSMKMLWIPILWIPIL